MSVSSALAQEKYAVLIVSDYEDPYSGHWNKESGEPSSETIEDTDEFWNDTYLMYGLLQNTLSYSEGDANSDHFISMSEAYEWDTLCNSKKTSSSVSNEQGNESVGGIPLFDHFSTPLPLWVDTITTQPEGYAMDNEGNVEISNSDGLVWLISTVNGLNGCEPYNFDGHTVRLTNDIDFGEEGKKRQFSSIGTRETPFMGIFDGDGHTIHNLLMWYPYTNGGVCDSDMGVFGYIRHAKISNVTIDSTCRIGSGCHNTEFNRGCLVGFSDSLSLIDNCCLHRYNYFGFDWGGALVGINCNSTIRWSWNFGLTC